MATLPDNATITAAGNYDVNVIPGKRYLLTVKGTWSGTFKVQTLRNRTNDQWDDVDGGSFTQNTECTFTAPTEKVRFEQWLGNPNLVVTLTEIKP